jgi:hypothetical protein
VPKTKYGKYIVDTLQQPKEEASWSPPDLGEAGKGKGGRVLYLDSNVAPGAFYMECVWVLPRPAGTGPAGARRVGTESHSHDYDEVIAFFGTNPDDPHDLGAEVELWLGDEKHIITKSSLVFIPAGLKHCPLTFLRVDRPVFHYTTGPGKMYM